MSYGYKPPTRPDSMDWVFLFLIAAGMAFTYWLTTAV